MLIHSITPMELLIEPQKLPQLTTQRINGGYVELQRNEQGYAVARVFSTDMSVYLDKKYAPGASWHSSS